MKKTAQLVRQVWAIFKPYHRHFGVVLVLLGVMEVISLFTPFLFGKVLNGMEGGISMRQAMYIAGLTYVVVISRIAAGHIKATYEVKNLDHVLDSNLEDSTLAKVQTLSIGQHRSQHSGITQNVINQGRQGMVNLVELSLYEILPTAARVVFTLVALVLFELRVGLVVLSATVLVVWFSLHMNKLYWPRISKWCDKAHGIGRFRHEILKNLSLIQINAQEKRVQREFKTSLDEYVTDSHSIWLPYIRYATARELIIATITFGVLLMGIHLVFNKDYQVGDFVILWAWTTQATLGLNNISHYQRQCLRLGTEVRKYLALLEIPPAVTVTTNPVRPPRLVGKIEFRNVSFTYRNQRYIELDEDVEQELFDALPALSDVSFIIQPGEVVAFVGESGAGKSTLITLLLRGYDPEAGQILVDDNDLRLLDLKHYRGSVGFVEQKVALFDNTMRYNMLFGLNGHCKDVTDEQLDVLAARSRINRFKHRLTNGWETRIGENGVKLSGGECQRVGIARALAKEPSILILDEATSNLDPKNERAIKEAVADASTGRTTIIIAHRLSTVRDADRIFVMDQGQVVAVGRHEELCVTSPVYRELVEDQLVAS